MIEIIDIRDATPQEIEEYKNKSEGQDDHA